MTDTYVTSETGKVSITKDPDAILDYTFDWTKWLQLTGDQIASQQGFVDGVAVVASAILGGTQVVYYVSGEGPGADGGDPSLTCQITTNSTPPKVEHRTIYFKIRER